MPFSHVESLITKDGGTTLFLNYVVFFLFFVSIMAITSLIREKIKGSIIKDLLRISIFFIPFLTPAIFYGWPNFNMTNVNGWLPYIVAISSSIIALAIQYRDYGPLLRKEVYPLLPPITLMTFIAIESSIIGSAIFEEFFYRTYVPESNFWIESTVAAGLFSFSHYIHPLTRNTFTWKSYLILFLLAVVWHYSYKISGTILPAIIGHLVYNSSSIVIIFRRYLFSRKEKSRWQEIKIK